MEIIYKRLDEIHPYKNNPRKNKDAVAKVKASIEEFGFKNPIILDENDEIVAGHTRYLAASMLDMDKVPCIKVSDLSPEQVKAFRLADNKTAEFSEWDFDLLDEELSDIFDIDMGEFGFNNIELGNIDWKDVDDLSEEKYDEPKESQIKCPKCGYVGSKHYFVTASTEENEDIS